MLGYGEGKPGTKVAKIACTWGMRVKALTDHHQIYIKVAPGARQYKNIRSTSRHLSYLVASLFPKGSVPEEEKAHRLPFQEFPTVARVEQLAHQPANTGIERFKIYCQEQIKGG